MKKTIGQELADAHALPDGNGQFVIDYGGKRTVFPVNGLKEIREAIACIADRAYAIGVGQERRRINDRFETLISDRPFFAPTDWERWEKQARAEEDAKEEE